MTKQKSILEIKAGWDKYRRPKDGEIYQHYKGGKYEVVSTGFIEENLEPCVVYRAIDADIVWVRTAQNFFEDIIENAQVVRRFKSINSG